MENVKKTTKTKVTNEIPSLSIVRRCIEVKQGPNIIDMTKTDVNAIKMLLEGQYENCYVSNVTPRVKYTLLKDKSIIATCFDDGRQDTVHLSKKTIEWIFKLRDNNRQKLSFDMDFIKRRYY